MTNFKNILQKSTKFSGIGLHTGQLINITVLPNPESGIKFIRIDLPTPVSIPAEVSLVTTTERGTTLCSNDASISTIEHLMAALSGLEIQDAIIEIDGPEIPILDGSAKIFVDELIKSGLIQEESTREVFEISEAFHFIDEETGSEYAVYPSDQFELNAILLFSDDTLGEMVATMKYKSDFVDQISKCRTFVMLSEIEYLLDKGLIQGGDTNNAVVIVDKSISQEKFESLRIKFNKPDIKVENGILSHAPLYYKNEPARHKLLDLIGDLSLFNKDIKGKIVAIKNPKNWLEDRYMIRIKRLSWILKR
jgi:UDP-3-O-[3-hydroxymyristoyl] N-acetylglucosamine deacetylase / 3-hydroxyacyl-[acyl-carrier-protein] dehydratase